ncbi:unnamed protein product [Spirodela intermedia]|uniref:NPH3 domain-containing protein n=1 Tax=Spirodela intermedia TaxID=51605 RepID=A0A7I8L5G3_SPIIN|nr:unnamed protein product [Spirodela intermedia]
MLPGKPPPDFRVLIHGVNFALNKRCMALRSARIARMLTEEEEGEERQRQGGVAHELADAPADPAAFEVVARFCHGYLPELSPENVVPVICVASFLEMTEEHSPENLLQRALSFFSSHVLPHWNETLRCLRGGAAVLPHAGRLGLTDDILHSVADKVLAEPLLLRNPVEACDDQKVKRRLFVVDWFAEDLTDLGLDLFVMAIAAVADAGAPPTEVARCLLRYARKRARVGASPGEEYEWNSHRRVVETVEKLLPREKEALQIKPLFQMLQSAIFLRAREECRRGLEERIGSLLAEAAVEDLFIPCHGYARETRHDVGCVERVVAQFCNAAAAGGGSPELGRVAELFEGYLAEAAAADGGLTKEMFAGLLRMLAWLLGAAGRGGDGVYRAVDAYFCAHGELTESEREEICRAALDCRRLSPAVCEQAAQNERMPLRVVAQVLYVGQMHIREAICGALKDSEGEPSESGQTTTKSGEDEEEEDDEEREEREENEECEMGTCGHCGGVAEGERRQRKKKKKVGFWREMKWKLGCKDAAYACNCSLRKVHPVG